jgi:citrate synthase
VIDSERARVPARLYDALRALGEGHPMHYGAYGVAYLGHLYAAEWSFEPDLSLPHAADALRMIRGGEAPGGVEARAFESSLVLYMDHGFNASTFTVRVIASTLSDMYLAVAGGIAALRGPLHGGANEAALRMLLDARKKAEEAGKPLEEYIEEYILEKLARKEKIMGFGHRLYKKKRDPRTACSPRAGCG